DQAVASHFLQLRPDGGEVAAEVDGEALLDSGDVQLEFADQRLDHGATDAVVAVAVQAAAGGQLAVGQALLVVVQVADVLAVQIADLTDGGDAQTNQVAVAVC